MASSSYSATSSAPAPELDPFRDVAGFLPLVSCHKCGTKLIARVSQKKGSKGMRFYKCPLLEHTDFACDTYMFEPEYVEYLVLKGLLPRYCSRIRSAELPVSADKAKDGYDMLKAAVEGVETCTGLLQSALTSFKDVEAKMNAACETEAKMDRIGERVLFLGLANLLVVVLVLMVFYVQVISW